MDVSSNGASVSLADRVKKVIADLPKSLKSAQVCQLLGTLHTAEQKLVPLFAPNASGKPGAKPVPGSHFSSIEAAVNFIAGLDSSVASNDEKKALTAATSSGAPFDKEKAGKIKQIAAKLKAAAANLHVAKEAAAAVEHVHVMTDEFVASKKTFELPQVGAKRKASESVAAPAAAAEPAVAVADKSPKRQKTKKAAADAGTPLSSVASAPAAEAVVVQEADASPAKKPRKPRAKKDPNAAAASPSKSSIAPAIVQEALAGSAPNDFLNALGSDEDAF